MPGLGSIDVYTIRARFFPAIIAGAPAIAFVAILVSWDRLALPHLIASFALAVILFVLSDVARRRGKALEPRLIKKIGGLPSIVMMRYADTTFDQASKSRMHKFLAGKIDGEPPSPADELENIAAADEFYRRCGDWLREHTRDTKEYKILFEENITYGFRRNLLGLKWPAFILNASIVLICLALLYYRVPLNLELGLTQKLISVLGISILHAVYLAIFVNEGGVVDASRQYARQLLLSCETLRPSTGNKK